MQRREHTDDDVAEVDLEEAAQRLASVGAAHAVGAERNERATRQEAGDLLGNDLHEVGDGDDRARRVGEQLSDVGRARLLAGVQAVPALDLERVLAQPLVRRRRPQLDADVEVLGQLGGSLRGPRPAPSRRTATWPVATGPRVPVPSGTGRA